MMLYSGGVLLSSAFISRLTDKIGKTRPTLFLGAAGSGLGLFLIGLIGWNNITQMGVAYLTTLLLLSGMLILGIAHGFIQAPIITHVTNTRTARKLGGTTATSIYRLFERIGNIGGPLLVGGMLVRTNYNASTVSWIGTGVLACGVLFLMRFRKSPATKKASLRR